MDNSILASYLYCGGPQKGVLSKCFFSQNQSLQLAVFQVFWSK